MSARSEAALDEMTREMARHLRGSEKRRDKEELGDIAYTLQVGRKEFGRRRFVVSREAAEAAEALEMMDERRVFDSEREAEGEARPVALMFPGGGSRPVTFMFPGQGTQHVNMGRELYRAEPVFKQHVDYCSDVLKAHLGFDLRTILYPATGEEEGARERLRQTLVTQPALFVIEYALAKLYESWGVRPAAMIGHSLGEYVAACLAGVFSLEDALAAVAARCRLMQEMPEGAMLAVTLKQDEVEALMGEGLWMAAVNAPALCVVSGAVEAVQEFEARLVDLGVMHRRLEVSHAFHSGMMEMAVEAFAGRLRGLRLNSPKIPFVSNLTGDWIREEEATDPSYWARHLRETVRFDEGVGRLLRAGGPVLLEVGFGRTLTKLVDGRADLPEGQPVLASLDASQGHEPEEAMLLCALGRLWLAGVEINWPALHANAPRRRVPLPTYPFERERYWIDAPRERAAGVAARRSLPGRRGDVADWFYVPAWRQTVAPYQIGAALEAGEDASWLVLLDRSGVGEKLVERLRGEGRKVFAAISGERFAQLDERLYAIDPARREDYAALLRAASAGGELPRRIVHLVG
ncbi:MAG: acyltransferase domain-containing protein, partial [Pyrinomonadaceae bacterium]